jgi:hypothetical protein
MLNRICCARSRPLGGLRCDICRPRRGSAAGVRGTLGAPWFSLGAPWFPLGAPRRVSLDSVGGASGTSPPRPQTTQRPALFTPYTACLWVKPDPASDSS